MHLRAAFAVCAAASIVAAFDDVLTIELQNGEQVVGSTCQTNLDVNEYLGIRYAKQPVRFTNPQIPDSSDSVTAANQRNSKGEHLATTFPPDCPQNPGYLGLLIADAGAKGYSEDCLFLNVYARQPQWEKSNYRKVMVYFHGGGWVNGAARIYNGCPVVAASPAFEDDEVVVVTVNYRLGIFGLLAASALEVEGGSSGAFWFRDQQLALQWVQNNIAAFGGDPRKVIIFGNSVGADSVAHHIASPGSAGLFRGAIMESYANYAVPYQTSKLMSLSAANALGCAALFGTEVRTDVACLRNKTVAELLPDDPSQAFWAAAYGTKDVPASVDELIATQQFNDVPVIIGYNNDEGSIFATNMAVFTTLGNARSRYSGFISDENVTAYITDWFKFNSTSPEDQAKIEKIMSRYPAANYTQYDDLKNFKRISDIISGSWKANNIGLARLMSQKKPKSDVYLYRFTHINSCFSNTLYTLPLWANNKCGGVHQMEVPFVWGRYVDTSNPSQTCVMSPREVLLSLQIMSRWRNLIDPRGPTNRGQLHWTPYNAADRRTLDINPLASRIRVFKEDEEEADFYASFFSPPTT